MAYSLDYYKRRKRYVENQIWERKNRNAVIKQEISQLEDAYKRLGRIKKSNGCNAALVKSNAKLSKVAGDVQWRGNSKKQFDNLMKGDVQQAAKDFYKSIDAMQDEVGKALDAKRGEYDTGIGVLNGLNKTRNWLSGVIRNWTN